MKYKHLLFFIVAILFTGVLSTNAKNNKNINAANLAVKWPQYISQFNLRWDFLPEDWDEAPFLGNGRSGLMVYKEKGKNSLRFELGNSLVHDHRKGSTLLENSRLLIGCFQLCPEGEITGGTMTLDIWNAEMTATLITNKGTITIQAMVITGEDGILIKAKPSAGEQNFKWNWEAANADCPRYIFGQKSGCWYKNPTDYVSNPTPEVFGSMQNGYCLQKLLEGGSTATAWKIKKEKSAQNLYVNISHAYPQSDIHILAQSEVNKIAAKKTTALIQTHRKWWHTYYPASFVSIPNQMMETFYWMQIYKIAAATRGNGDLVDNTGPWLTVTPWPNAWWNLNVQLTYWLLNGSNRLDLSKSLENAVYNNVDVLINNIPEKFRYNAAGLGRSSNLEGKSILFDPIENPGAEIGLLPWACHSLWLIYRHNMDDETLRNKLFPLLKKSTNYYIHFLIKGEDGKFHLPATHSPEYGNAEDCNFDFSLLRWSCQTLVESAQRLKLNDDLIPVWKDILANLVEYPTNENGLMIGKNKPYAVSHRHFSHLLMIYPLYLLNSDQGVDSLALIKKSTDYWLSLKGHHEGYSHTGASSIYSSIGDGDKALSSLKKLFSTFLRPNTMYKEAGPCIETPLSGAQSMHDMLLQSWGNKIRIFPAVPSEWKDVSFYQMRTQGAFLVSAKRVGGKTVFINIQSLVGELCIIKTDMKNPVSADSSIRLIQIEKGIYKIAINKGMAVSIFENGNTGSTTISPVNKQYQQTFFGRLKTK